MSIDASVDIPERIECTLSFNNGSIPIEFNMKFQMMMSNVKTLQQQHYTTNIESKKQHGKKQKGSNFKRVAFACRKFD